MKTTHVLLLTISLLIGSGCRSDDERAQTKPSPAVHASSARELFELYVKLSRNFDPAVADLYSDTAVLRNTRISPTGQRRVITLSGTEYKALLSKTMPTAKSLGHTSSYRDVEFTNVGPDVRITATRHADLKNYDSPIEILVSKDKNGHWLITEEISQSRP